MNLIEQATQPFDQEYRKLCLQCGHPIINKRPQAYKRAKFCGLPCFSMSQRRTRLMSTPQRDPTHDELEKNYRLIPLTKGHNAIVDTADYESIAKRKWHASLNAFNGAYYAVAYGRDDSDRRMMIWMHRLLLNAPPSLEVDHIDRDTLNNRRSNLRLATRQMNMYNQPKQRVNTSGFKGVFIENGRFRAMVRVKGRLLHLGTFDTAEEAANAYQSKLIEIAGQFARW